MQIDLDKLERLEKGVIESASSYIQVLHQDIPDLIKELRLAREVVRAVKDLDKYDPWWIDIENAVKAYDAATNGESK